MGLTVKTSVARHAFSLARLHSAFVNIVSISDNLTI